MKPSHLIISIITVFFFKGVHLSKDKQVSQTPTQLLIKPNVAVNLTCSHDIKDYDTILWYQRSAGDTSLKLIAYMRYKNSNVEPAFQSHFAISGDGEKTAYLHILNSRHPEDTGEYFGAANGQGMTGAEAYFGKGTKLTVLESSVVPPTVNVLKPSTKECRNSKDDARRKTIVCVASNFYPDHVSVKWQVGGTDVTRGVVTGTAQRKKGETSYKITSRLTVSAENWNTGGHEFKCIVSFFDGNITMYFNDTVYGEATTTSVLTREKYLKITQTAKLAYAVFIIKSAIYGIFIAYLVWRIQGSFGKLSN